MMYEGLTSVFTYLSWSVAAVALSVLLLFYGEFVASVVVSAIGMGFYSTAMVLLVQVMVQEWPAWVVAAVLTGMVAVFLVGIRKGLTIIRGGGL